MNRLWLIICVSVILGIVGLAKAQTVPPLQNVFNPNTGRQDYIINPSTMSVGYFVDISTAGISDGQCLVWSAANSQFEAGACGVAAATNNLLLETDDIVLLETGDNILLE